MTLTDSQRQAGSKPHQIHAWVPVRSQANRVFFSCLLSEHGWTGHQRRRHRSCHWRKWGWLVDSWKEWAARLCARFLSRKDLMKNSPNPQTLKIFYDWKQRAYMAAAADQGQPIILSSTVTSQEITNWPCFLLPSYPDPLYPWHLLAYIVCKNWLHLSEMRTWVSYRGPSHYLHTVLPSVLQVLVSVGEKSCLELNYTKGKRTKK